MRVGCNSRGGSLKTKAVRGTIFKYVKPTLPILHAYQILSNCLKRNWSYGEHNCSKPNITREGYLKTKAVRAAILVCIMPT